MPVLSAVSTPLIKYFFNRLSSEYNPKSATEKNCSTMVFYGIMCLLHVQDGIRVFGVVPLFPGVLRFIFHRNQHRNQAL